MCGGLAFGQLDVITPPPTTLWKFLGIPQARQALRDGVSNRFGNRPWMERRPPVKPLAHPDNLESQNPAIKRAAEIKSQEDLAPQKIKAVKYLAKIGCGCYDKDGSVTAALIAAMEDCTERVRLATVEAIKEATEKGACTTCNQKCCCNEDLVKKLYELAYEKDNEGCWLEPSEEVRQAAREAMMACCRGRGPEGPIYEEPLPGTAAPAVTPVIPPERGPVLNIPPEIPDRTLPPEIPQGEAPPAPPFQESPSATIFEEYTPSEGFSPALPTFRAGSAEAAVLQRGEGAGVVKLVEYSQGDRPAGRTSTSMNRLPSASFATPSSMTEAPNGPEGFSAPSAPAERTAAPNPTFARGVVESIDGANALLHVHFEGAQEAPVGARMIVYHEYLVGRTRLGQVEVVQSWQGAATMRPVDGAMFNKIRRGDEVVYAPGG
jgi:hypothetical protein